jgi:hypothetical protein
MTILVQKLCCINIRNQFMYTLTHCLRALRTYQLPKNIKFMQISVTICSNKIRDKALYRPSAALVFSYCRYEFPDQQIIIIT